MISDTHCHLFFDDFLQDLNSVLERAWDSGIDRILMPGIDIPTSRQALELAENHENLFVAVGTHPNNANSWKINSLDELSELCSHPKVVAIGEIGLDYYRDRTPREIQQAAVIDQLDLAAEKNLPVILHCRQAFDDLYEFVSKWLSKTNLASRLKIPGVFHSFEGTIEQAKKVIDINFYIGINGSITFPKADERRDVVKNIHENYLLMETDAPFLSPQSHRGRRNEPGYLPIIVDKVAEIKDRTPTEIAKISSINANTIFDWGTVK
ncbi:MAG: TatD family hydrolase [Anaerolineae bacterium]|jgi:TatD DNase family protein|nr:TatD family hydrolase [Anaerolineae bacterium]